MRSSAWALVVVAASFAACKGESEDARGGGGAGRALPDAIAVSGQIAVSADADPLGVGESLAGSQLVELVDDAGAVVAQGTSDGVGAFTIAINKSELGLVNDGQGGLSLNGSAPRLMRLRSLFLAKGEEKPHAVGIRQPIIITAEDLISKDGTPTLDTGTHSAKRVGAIVGNITLETNADPTGIEVYVPGTTYIAKTDANGQFLLGFLPQGDFRLVAERDGYNSQEWPNVPVGRDATTHLDAVVLPIAKGPKIDLFKITDVADERGTFTLLVELSGATKYRISKQSDFGDTVFKPVDQNEPKFEVTLDLSSGVKVFDIHIEAADSDGLSATKKVTLDREAPLLGTIAVAGEKTVVSSTSVPLLLGARNATKMRFAESADELATAASVAYATTYSYSLEDESDGTKIIYVEYLDDSGNATGSGGEINVAFTLDTTAPPAALLTLLAPASPTGAFNTPLAWQGSYTEPVSYEVEVHTQSDYDSAPIREMSTDDISLTLNPPLDTIGTYYWRVRAIDRAGNPSAWVVSGASKKFELRVLAQAYQPRREIKGEESGEFLARTMTAVGDMTGDGKTEVAYSVAAVDYSYGNSTCYSCSEVNIIDPTKQEDVATLREGLSRTSFYGHRVIGCDLDGDGADEIVVSAPGEKITRNGHHYEAAGAVYVYDRDDLVRLHRLVSPLGGSDPAPGYSCYSEWDPATNTNRQRCGWPLAPEPIEGMMAATEGNRFGWSLACMRQAGADQLFVGEPGFGNSGGPGSRIGRVLRYGLAGNTLAQQESIEEPALMMGTDFGASLAYLPDFVNSGCAAGAAGPTLAVGAPRRLNGNTEGAVHLFRFGASTWNDCATIEPTGVTNNMVAQKFGMRLHGLGDVNGDGADELAIASTSWNGGLMRIYGGPTGAMLKSLLVDTDDGTTVGYDVTAAGDFNDDNVSEIAISAPRARVNGQFETGKVMIYDLADIDDDDNNSDADSDGSPLLTLTGKPVPTSFMGASFVPVLANGDLTTKPDVMLVSRPGLRKNGGGCPPGMAPPCGGGAAPAGGAGFNEPIGSLEEFAFLKLAPGLPTRVVGESTKARMGASIVGAGDIDADGATDVLIGQPGGRCDGRPFGAISLYSVLDGALTRSFCAARTGDKMGSPLLRLSGGQFLFGNLRSSSGDLYVITESQVLQMDRLEQMQNVPPSTDPAGFFGRSNAIGADRPSISVAMSIGSMQPEDLVLVGDADFSLDRGVARGLRVRDPSNNPRIEAPLFEIEGDQLSDGVGTGVALISEFTGSALADQHELLIGAPGIAWDDDPMDADAAVDGVVYLINRDSLGGGFKRLPPSAPSGISTSNILLTFSAKDAVDGTEDAQAGFGSFVLGVGNLGTYDEDGPDQFPADRYVMIANTNMAHDSDSDIPEYFIYAVKCNPGPACAKKLVKHVTGTAGSMLGGYAKLLPDINGDGVPDLAISQPGGTGQLGATGQVQIISGAALTTPDEDDDLMQVLYNPDPSASNFGVSIEYADMTGDGLPDFIIGADEFDSPSYLDAGAVYVFAMAPVK